MSWNRLYVSLSDLVMLAQADAGAPGNPAGAAPAGGNGAGQVADVPPNPLGPLGPLIPVIAVGFFMYFIVIRPQYKAQKEKRLRHEELLASLKKNDRVVTIGGIIGTIADVSDDRVTLKIDDNTRMKLLRSAVQELLIEKTDKTDKQDSQ